MPKQPVKTVPTHELAPKVAPHPARCLGPGSREHQFFSPNPVSIRVCGDCRKRLDNVGNVLAVGINCEPTPPGAA